MGSDLDELRPTCSVSRGQFARSLVRTCHDVGMLAALPPGQPGKGQVHEAFRIARVPVELEVLIDCDTVSETTSCFEALAVLLATHGIRTWRYSDDGPPAEVRRSDDEATGAPFGWVEVLETGSSEVDSPRPTVTHLARHFDGKVIHTSNMWRRTGWPGPESATALLGRAAEATRMGVLVTNRDRLAGAGIARWHGETLFQTPEQAVATLGLLLRCTGNFPIRPYTVTTRGTYLWLALDSLLPHYGLWAAACSEDGVAGPGRIYYLSTATQGRLFQALNARDQVADAMSQLRIDWVDVADAVDRFLVFLLAAMDTTARVTYEIVRPENVLSKDAKWQFTSFLKVLRPSCPSLAALFEKGTAGYDLHLTLRKLRNTVHGGGLTQTHVLVDDGDLEHKLSIPLDEVDGLTGAVHRRTGGDLARWGLHQSADRLWIQPIPLVDALTREGLGILDAVFERTPLETLTEINGGSDIEVDEIDYVPDAVELSSLQVLDKMLATRGSKMYLWHLGMHPDQFA